MPTYEYVCDACEHEFEEFQSMSAKALKKCPSCAKPKLRRKIGAGAGIIFKGSGFYETDYRSDGYKKAEKAEKDTPAASDAGGAAKGEGASGGDSSAKPAAPAKAEAKPAAKSESKSESKPKKAAKSDA